MSNNNEAQPNDNTKRTSDTHIPEFEYDTNVTPQSTTDENTQQPLHNNIAQEWETLRQKASVVYANVKEEPGNWKTRKDNTFTKVVPNKANQTLKLGLHIVVRVAEHACDDASKRVSKPSTYRLQIFLVRDQYLRSLLPHGDKTIAGQLEKHVLKPMLAILTTYMETRLKAWSPYSQKDRKAWFPLDRNAIVESYDSSMFSLTAKRLTGI